MEDKIQDSVNSKLLSILNERGYGDLARHIISAYGRDEMINALLRSQEIYEPIAEKLLQAMNRRLDSEMRAVIEERLETMRLAMNNQIREWVRDELQLMRRADDSIAASVTNGLSSFFLTRMKDMLANELRSSREDLEVRYQHRLDNALDELADRAPAQQQVINDAANSTRPDYDAAVQEMENTLHQKAPDFG